MPSKVTCGIYLPFPHEIKSVCVALKMNATSEPEHGLTGLVSILKHIINRMSYFILYYL